MVGQIENVLKAFCPAVAQNEFYPALSCMTAPILEPGNK